MTIELLNPRGVSYIPQVHMAPRLENLSNKVLGLIDNSKDNADLFLNRISELIAKAFQIREIHIIKKPVGSVPASYTKDFLDNCDCVINAFGD